MELNLTCYHSNTIANWYIHTRNLPIWRKNVIKAYYVAEMQSKIIGTICPMGTSPDVTWIVLKTGPKTQILKHRQQTMHKEHNRIKINTINSKYDSNQLYNCLTDQPVLLPRWLRCESSSPDWDSDEIRRYFRRDTAWTHDICQSPPCSMMTIWEEVRKQSFLSTL
jgi:hypothetical protein